MHLLEIEDLSVTFATEEGPLHAVSNVSLHLDRGETLGIVGESGSGKSALSMAIPRLLPMPPATISAKKILFNGQDLTKIPTQSFRNIRGKQIGVIFQEPMTALSPLHRIGDQISEVILLHKDISKSAAREISLDWLNKVGVKNPTQSYNAFPHEFSGGMQQRVMIAMALVLDPDLIIADEPTTALDVTTQAQILKLIRNLAQKNSAILLITHDMGVIYEMATRVSVMYLGEIVETAPVRDIFQTPRHPYTKALLSSLPSEHSRGTRLNIIKGSVPSPINLPPGCHFANRCPLATPECHTATSFPSSVRCIK